VNENIPLGGVADFNRSTVHNVSSSPPVPPASDSTTYSVSEVGKDYILLSGSGTLRSIDKESNDENGVGTKYNLTGTEQCSYKLDRQSKWILEGKIISELRGYAEIKTDSIPAKTPMHIVTETIITGNSN